MSTNQHSAQQNQQINLLNVALRMLFHSRKKLIGMMVGATFSAFILMQQPGIYRGVIDRLVAQVQSMHEVDLWVMDKDAAAFEHPALFTASDLYRVRSVPGVEWAVQLYRFWFQLKHLKTNQNRTWELVGVDPSLLVGLPKELIAGKREHIHLANSIIIDGYSMKQLETDDQNTVQLGDNLLEGHHTWRVMGVTKPLRTYMTQPKLYMASNHIPGLAGRPSFILVKVKPNYAVDDVARKIHDLTHFDALTPLQFEQRTKVYFRKKTPIVINFVSVAILGFIIGLIVMWQIFSNFILTHLHQFGMLKMLGVSNQLLRRMVLFQASIIGWGGYVMGLLLTVVFGMIFYDTIVAFHLTWGIALLGALGSAVIIVLSSYFSILKVIRLDTVELCRDLN